MKFKLAILSIVLPVALLAQDAFLPRGLRSGTLTARPTVCVASIELYNVTNAATAGQQLYVCNDSGTGWVLVGDGGGGGSGDVLGPATNSDAYIPMWNGANSKTLLNGIPQNTFAAAAKGVTNGDSHDHSGGDGAQIAYSTLSGLPTLGNSAALNVGTTTGTVAAGDDSRLSDARTPSAHTTSHQNGGSDEIATATPGANAIPKAGAGGTLADGWLSTTWAKTSTPDTTGTAPNWATGVLNIPMAATASVTAGLLSRTQYDTFNGKPDLVGAGTAAIAAFNAGNAATASRSDHTHRSFATLSWFFPGVVVSGTQTARSLVPEDAANCTITNSRISVGTVSGASSTYNIARCTTSAGNCTATANIYSSAVTLNASTQSVAGGAPNTATVTAGDAFIVTLTPGASLADVTVAMTYKCESIN